MNDVTAQLNHSWCVTLGDLYILPNFATVSTSTGLPCMTVAWGGVEQWSDRNPKRNCKSPANSIYKILKNTKKIQNKSEKYKKKMLFQKHIGLNHIALPSFSAKMAKSRTFPIKFD